MEKISLLIAKKVITLDEGKCAGYVLDVVFDEKIKIVEGFLVADDETENVFFLNRKHILSKGNDCVMIESEQLLEYDLSSFSNNPIGKEVYDDKGVFFGKVIDVHVFGKNVKKIITNKCEFSQKFIKKSGIDYLIFGINKKQKNKGVDNNYSKNDKKMIKNDKKNAFLPKVEIMGVDESPKVKQIRGEDPFHKQIRVFANPNVLIGRELTADLFGFNNELIARKNEKIDKKIIKNAKNHNKLSFLAHFSR